MLKATVSEDGISETIRVRAGQALTGLLSKAASRFYPLLYGRSRSKKANAMNMSI